MATFWLTWGRVAALQPPAFAFCSSWLSPTGASGSVSDRRRRFPDVTAIYYRFGSSAGGVTREKSDVDLAFLAPSEIDPVRRFEIQEQLAAVLRRDVDLIDLRAASTVMQMQVVAHGVTLAAAPAATDRFEAFVFSSYARLNEERRTIIEQAVRSGAVHG